jgi:uncharacterized protein (UPF0276 family)
MDLRLPNSAGIGLRAPHVPTCWRRARRSVVRSPQRKLFRRWGPALAALDGSAPTIRFVAWRGSLAGFHRPLDTAHLAKLARLVDRIQPAQVSEHLCWSSVNGRHFNDLLPLPYTREALDHVCARVAAVQDCLGREILVENVSSYMAFPESTMMESEFVVEVAVRSGCRLLVDVNNIYVNARNHGSDAEAYLAAIPPAMVAEIHLAGFDASGPCLIDTHGAPVAPEVWALYERALRRFGRVPTLIEWDTHIPEFAVLQREAATAQSYLEAELAVAA